MTARSLQGTVRDSCRAMLRSLVEGSETCSPNYALQGGFSARSLMAEASPSNTAMTLIRLVT